MTEDEKFEEMVREEKMQITVRLPKRAEGGFERWREYLGMSKGAFAALAIRVGMAHMQSIVHENIGLPGDISIPPEDALELIDREAPDEKEY